LGIRSHGQWPNVVGIRISISGGRIAASRPRPMRWCPRGEVNRRWCTKNRNQAPLTYINLLRPPPSALRRGWPLATKAAPQELTPRLLVAPRRNPASSRTPLHRPGPCLRLRLRTRRRIRRDDSPQRAPGYYRRPRFMAQAKLVWTRRAKPMSAGPTLGASREVRAAVVFESLGTSMGGARSRPSEPMRPSTADALPPAPPLKPAPPSPP
jgi:hypothetical protein